MISFPTSAEMHPLSRLNPATAGSAEALSAARHDPPSRLALPFFSSKNTTNPNQAELPSFWPSRAPMTSPQKPKQEIFKGWRLIIFNSWLNVLLIFVPISWALSLTTQKAHSMIFALSILALVPLVKLHDLSTRELAVRIGGTRTGLLNASMGNMVEVVLAISALRKCELRVVQSALVGSILSKLLLVLGLCFFAGGMRFSEQGFDATTTQVHSSLMSISVGALLLPAAYHFTLEGGNSANSEQQGRNILHMSHGVSIVLLFIYGAYLLFQLWSHTHLYHDGHNKKSRRLSVNIKVPKETADFIKNAGKRIATSISAIDLSKTTSRNAASSGFLPPRTPYSQSQPAYGSSASVHSSPEDFRGGLSEQASSSIELASSPMCMPMARQEILVDVQSSNTAVPETSSPLEENTQEHLDSRSEPEMTSDRNPREPQLSWVLTLCLLLVVTIAVAVTAEWLVGSMDGISSTVSKEWIGLIVLPSVSAVAECMTAVNVSVRDQLTLSVSVAVGSGIQTALFVFPFMVILAWTINKPLSLLLDPFQSLVLYLSVQIMSYVVADGKSNWLEGVILICLYIIVAVSFWFYPGSNLPDSLAMCSA